MYNSNKLQHDKNITRPPVTQFALPEKVGVEHHLYENHFVYCVGNINAKFPTLNLEKELNQNSIMSSEQLPMLDNVNDNIALERLNRNKNLYQQLFKGLSQPNNRYIARSMEWVLDNRFNEQQYKLLLSTDELLTQCISALGRTESSKKGQVAIVGSVTDAGEMFVTAIMPTTVMPFGQLLNGEHGSNAQFLKLIDEITALDSSSGNTDGARALNFALYNNVDIYNHTYSLYYNSSSDGPNPSGYQLLAIDTDTLTSGDRIVVNVIFKYQGINTGALQFWYCRVDVTGEYPFIVSSWQQYLPSFKSK
ncbi:hypothetical protein B0W48_13800 [Pseudoalteromonas aliena]|uniref:PatG C-terminal domain-containing protein n=1 Tax=Pseudoalteromonas aliena TaxID=247523 RepID=A0A1Q2H0B3_9GAMM|nr:hypothetical protein [Pseudoalteromonas aliena]AQQ00788.1 hypothetical protein B0W48_13800 [Pseudoalteromonas aliena]